MKVQNLSVQTRNKIFTNFNFNFELNQLYGIVATNGSGKTTFFRALTGLIPVQSGSILVNSKKIFYFESSEWFDDNLSGTDYLTFIKESWHSEIEISELVDLWSMQEYIHLPIKKYSLGMKQRLLISMYFISDAQILLMDEITNGLDEESRAIFFNCLSKLKNKNKLIIISSHYKEDLENYCDRLLTIKNGGMELI